MEQEIQKLVEGNTSWELVDQTLIGNWKFADFLELKEMVGKLCDLADELNHHPAVTYGYNTLRIETTTHDAGDRVTEKDIELALRISKIMVGE